MLPAPTIPSSTQDAAIAPAANSSERMFDWSLLALVLSVFVAMLIIVAWGLNRGFDIKDEGYYLLMAHNPAEYVSTTAFHFVLSKLPNLTGNMITNLRLFQVLSQILAAVVLALGFWRYFASTNPGPTKAQLLTSILFASVGTMLFQASFPPSLSYNGLTSFCLFTSFGLLFAGSANSKEMSRWLIFSAGLLAGFLLFIKFPCLISTLPLSFLWLALSSSRRRLLPSYLIGLLCSPIIFLIFIQSPEQFKEQVTLVNKFLGTPTPHSPNSLIKIYWNDIATTATAIWQNFALALLTPIMVTLLSAFLFAKSRLPRVKVILACLPILSFVAAIPFTKFDICLHAFDWYTGLYASLLLCFLTTLTLIVFGYKRANGLNWPLMGALTILFLLPVVCSAGSGNLILFQCSTCLAPAFLAISALLFLPGKHALARANCLLVVLLLSAVTIFRFVNGYVYHPYFLCDSLLSQNYDASRLPSLKGIRLSRPALEFLTAVSDLLRQGGFQRGDQIIGLYDLPGVVYAVGGNAPVVAWLFPSKEFEKFRPTWFHDIAAKAKPRLFLLTSWDLAPKTIASLQKAGIDFPKDFSLLGKTQIKPYEDGYGEGNCGADDRYLGGEIRVYKRLSN
jgi:hypothetical protein